MDIPIQWTALLEEEDWLFIKRFLLTSGSLKEIANYYNVTYPTVRLRLDRLISKIQISDSNSDDSFVSMIKKYTIDDKIEYDVAKHIISEYRKSKEVK
jgi:hypothetical protein